MVRVVKELIDGKYRYVKVLDFKDEVEQDVIYEKIVDIVREHKTKVKVY